MGTNLMGGRPQKADPTHTRGRSVHSDTVLPVDGYQGPIPEWPLADGATADEFERWIWLWRKPQAVEWVLCGIEDLVARYVRNCISLEQGGNLTVASAHLVSEIRQQEDRLGRTPLALLRMRWSVGAKEQAAMKAERAEGTVRRLRAIDPAVAAEG